MMTWTGRNWVQRSNDSFRAPVFESLQAEQLVQMHHLADTQFALRSYRARRVEREHRHNVRTLKKTMGKNEYQVRG